MPRIDLSRAAGRFLERLPSKHTRQIERKLAALCLDPRPPDSKVFQGHLYLRVDQGEYRIIYQVRGDILDVRLIGKRNDDEAYRQLARLD